VGKQLSPYPADYFYVIEWVIDDPLAILAVFIESRDFILGQTPMGHI